MKFLNVMVLGFVLTTSMARAEIISATAAGASITFLSYSGIMSAAGCAQEKNPDLCGLGVLSGHLALSASTVLLLKENVKEVEADSLNVLAGEPMSLAFEEIIQELRHDSEKLEGVSDLEIAGMILQSLGK